MARVGWIPWDQDREDQKVEDAADRRANRNARIDPIPESTRFGRYNPEDEEFNSVDDFAEFTLDNDSISFDHHQLACLNFRTGIPVREIKTRLEALGMVFQGQQKVQSVRGICSNPNAGRWTGAGGGGGDAITGFAGKAG